MKIILLLISFIFTFESAVYSLSDAAYKTNLRVPMGVSKNRGDKQAEKEKIADQIRQVVNNFIPLFRKQGKQAGAVVLHPSANEFAEAFENELNPTFEKDSIPALCVKAIFFDPNKEWVGRETDLVLDKIEKKANRDKKGYVVVPFVICNRLEGSKNIDAPTLAGFLRAQRNRSVSLFFVTIFTARTDFEYFLSLKRTDFLTGFASRQYHTEVLKYVPGMPIEEAMTRGANIFDFSPAGSPKSEQTKVQIPKDITEPSKTQRQGI